VERAKSSGSKVVMERDAGSEMERGQVLHCGRNANDAGSEDRRRN